MPMTALTGAVGALILSLAITPLIAWASRRYGYVAHPRGDRWHEKPTALFGGVDPCQRKMCIIPPLIAVVGNEHPWN